MPETQRGEVWLVDPGLAAKVRPCLVISVPVTKRDRALVTGVPHTTSPSESRFEVEVATRFLRPGVFDAQNLVTIPRSKFLRKLGILFPSQLRGGSGGTDVAWSLICPWCCLNDCDSQHRSGAGFPTCLFSNPEKPQAGKPCATTPAGQLSQTVCNR
jgi:mRNA interferase MazF